MTKVFLSYSHDNEAHRTRVSALGQRLREHGVTIVLDTDKLPSGPDEGWPMWSEQQVVEAEKVLIACTHRYRLSYDANEPLGQGLGAACEARAIRQTIYDLAGINAKFRVILFDPADVDHVPLNLKAYHRFELWREQSVLELIDWLQGSQLGPAAAVLPIQWPNISVQRERAIANRDEEFACFERMLSGPSDQRVLLIRAASNRGKTVLMGEFHKFAHLTGVAHCFVDLKGNRSIDEVLEDLAIDTDGLLCGLGAAGLAQRQSALLRDLQNLPVPLVLAFDTYEQSGEKFADWLGSRILQRMDRFPALRIVVAGQTAPEATKTIWESHAAFFELQPINDKNHWCEFGRRHYANVPEQELMQFVPGLIRVTGGDPGAIGNLLKQLAASYSSSGASA